ncbi:MAG: DUF4397 domain-containing protein, partial [Deltaproteobacteria bacterium]|nr:DUF4397 domain-containing protein [Candidatus Kapabacteria bacterium]
MKQHFLLLSLVLFILGWVGVSAQTATVTFLHNSPDPAMAQVDVYITQYDNTAKADNVNYKDGLMFTDAIIFGGLEVFIDVAPANSGSKDDAVVRFSFTPEADAGYQVELFGVQGTDGWLANPDGEPINLRVKQQIVPNPEPVVGEVGLMFSHGVTDMESVDVYLRGAAAPVFTSVKYGGTTTETKNVKRQLYTIDLTVAGNKNNVLASFECDFSTIPSDVIFLTSSGFKIPNDNNKSENGLYLLATLDNGSVIKYPMLSGSQKSRMQLINASADPVLAMVDLYVNGTRAADNLAYKKATGFIDYEAGTPVIISIGSATSTKESEAFFRDTLEPLRPGRTYQVVVCGVSDTASFSNTASGAPAVLQYIVAEGALEESTDPAKTAVRTIHTVTDLGTVDVRNATNTYAGALTYTAYSPEYIMVEPAIDTVWLYSTTNGTPIRGWIADLRGTKRAVTMLLTGFFGPDSNQSGPLYNLVLIEPNGTINDKLSVVQPQTEWVAELVHGSDWQLSPNPASATLNLMIPFGNSEAAAIGTSATALLYSAHGEQMLSTPL